MSCMHFTDELRETRVSGSGSVASEIQLASFFCGLSLNRL